MSEVYSVQAEDLKDSTFKLLLRLGIEPPKRSRILIKPNLVEPKTPDTGVTTHPEIVAGIIEYFQRVGSYEIVVAEGSSAYLSESGKIAELCAYPEMLKRYGVPFIDLKRSGFTEKVVYGRRVDVAKPALEADFIVTVAVLKVHQNTTLTLGLKNLKGCISDPEKRRFHTIDLDEAIVDVNSVLSAGLCVMDAVVGIRKGSCVSGEPFNLGLILAGDDTVAVDAVCSALIGMEPLSIRHIRLASERGLGEADLTRIRFRGAEPRKPVKPQSVRLDRFPKLHDAGACSACAGAVVVALDRLASEPSLPLFIGPHEGAEGLLVGKCPQGKGPRVKGCPPRALDIVKFLERYS